MLSDLGAIWASISTHLSQLESAVKGWMMKVPYVGRLVSENLRLVGLLVLAMMTILVVKPLLKWAVIVTMAGALAAVAVAPFLQLPFVKVLPFSCCAAGLVLLALRK